MGSFIKQSKLLFGLYFSTAVLGKHLSFADSYFIAPLIPAGPFMSGKKFKIGSGAASLNNPIKLIGFS